VRDFSSRAAVFVPPGGNEFRSEAMHVSSQVSSEDLGSSSTRSVKPQIPSDTTSMRWRPAASTIVSAGWNHFASLTIEEKLTYRNWRRTTLIFYAVFICGLAAIAIAIGPGDQSSTAKKSDIYSALASVVQRSSR